ncbi:hypothetical protein LIER_32705 [Lithospermum erythrorhizon]|uniref:Uncharacterized protein n=1 Tax=Lithospermum erythrorhizon TaxID=34254 RepID=A0AAV3RYM3_LITER
MSFTNRLDGVPLPKEVNNKVAYMTFYRGLRYGKLKKALVLETPLSKDELTARLRQYVELEELKNKEGKTKDLHHTLRKTGRSKLPLPHKGLVQCTRQLYNDGLTPLKVSVAEVYTQIKGNNLLPKPVRMRSGLDRRDNTNECKILNAEIEKLIKRGYLKRV